MSMYNMLFGENPQAALLKFVLDLDNDTSKWKTGRYRDIFLNKDGTEIHVYTRNGGGNRIHVRPTPEGIDCDCPACIMKYLLPTHPRYLRDYDDELDPTYATVAFSLPESYKALLYPLIEERDNFMTPEEKWADIFEHFEEKMENDIAFREKAMAMMEKILVAMNTGKSADDDDSSDSSNIKIIEI